MSLSALLTEYGDLYLHALLNTWRLTALSFAGAFAIGVVITVLRVCPVKPLRVFGDFFVQVFRNIPGAALLILLVYALPRLRVLLSYEMCVIVASVLIPSAFCSEHLMSGMNTIHPGEIEAARALGLTFTQMIAKDRDPPGAAEHGAAHDQPGGGHDADHGAGLPGAAQAQPAGADRRGELHQQPRRGRHTGLRHLRRAVRGHRAGHRLGGRQDRQESEDTAMSAPTIRDRLYEAPGPKTRRRIAVFTGPGALGPGLPALSGRVRQFARQGQLDSRVLGLSS